MGDQSHVEPRRSPSNSDLAFIDPDNFNADPGYYVDWVFDNKCDLAVETANAKKPVLGLAVLDSAATSVGSTVDLDKQVLADNVSDVLEVLRSGRVFGQIRIDEPTRKGDVVLISHGDGVLSSAKDVDYRRPVNELIELVQEERDRQTNKKKPVEPADSDTPDQPEQSDDLAERVRENIGPVAKEVALRTVQVAALKAAIEVAKYAREVWKERDAGVANKVRTDAQEKVRNIRKRGFGL